MRKYEKDKRLKKLTIKSFLLLLASVIHECQGVKRVPPQQNWNEVIIFFYPTKYLQNCFYEQKA